MAYVSKYSGEEIDAAIERILDPGAFFATLTVTTTPGAKVTAVSGAFSYSATAGSNGKAVIGITSPRTYAVIVAIGGQTGSGAITIVAHGGDYNISVFPAVASLNDSTWAEIRAVSDAGQAAERWKLGDTKTIHLKGSFGGLYADFDVDAFIIGFDHNASIEGSNRIHFQIGKIGGVDVALVDSLYESSGSSPGFRINITPTVAGGWKNSYMRNTVLNSGGNPNNPQADSMLSALPNDLRSVMKPCVKYTDNAGTYPASTANVTHTTEYIVLPSLFETIGQTDSLESEYQRQYDYYKTGKSTIKYKHLNISSAALTWTRTIYISLGGGSQFHLIHSTGASSALAVQRSLGVSPIFCV